MAARPTRNSPSCARELLAGLALAACTSDAPLAADETSSTGLATTTAPTTGEPTTSGDTTGAPDCAPQTRCAGECVDLAADPRNCGDCGVTCLVDHATAVCTAGACDLGACDPGRADCNDDLADGCEAALAEGDPCPLVCAADAPELCNLFDDDCDGACDESVAGCRAPVHRAKHEEVGRLYTLDPVAAMTPPYSLELPDYFHLHSAPQPGLVPFHHCELPSGQNYYTVSPTCDDIAVLKGEIGYVATIDICGAVPLYRLSRGPMNDYLYTADPAERDDAILNLAYMYEAVAAHVWLAP